MSDEHLHLQLETPVRLHQLLSVAGVPPTTANLEGCIMLLIHQICATTTSVQIHEDWYTYLRQLLPTCVNDSRATSASALIHLWKAAVHIHQLAAGVPGRRQSVDHRLPGNDARADGQTDFLVSTLISESRLPKASWPKWKTL